MLCLPLMKKPDHLDKKTRRRISKLGGKARAKKINQRRRTEIAQKAAQQRWKGHKKRSPPAPREIIPNLPIQDSKWNEYEAQSTLERSLVHRLLDLDDEQSG